MCFTCTWPLTSTGSLAKKKFIRLKGSSREYGKKTSVATPDVTLTPCFDFIIPTPRAVFMHNFPYHKQHALVSPKFFFFHNV